MKKLFLIIGTLTLTFGIFAQTPKFLRVSSERPNLVLTGEIKEIIAEEINPNTSSGLYIVYITLNLKLENKGLAPVIFLQPNPIVYDAFVKNEEQNILATTPGFRTSIAMFSNDWEKIKKKLDKKIPPPEEIITIQPNQTKSFENFVRFNIPKYGAEYSLTRVLLNQNLSLLQKLSPLKLYLDCESWTTLPLHINNKVRESLKTRFGKKLRQKWVKYGYLWLDHINSEPISINFNSIIFKNLVD